MPADVAHGLQRDQLRKSIRKGAEEGEGSHARDIELKRSRGEISCAECRRLKIKCDKKLPCSSCVRRGCASLCPNGSLATGQGTRFVLAATDHLHKRIGKMSERVRQLEDALAILQNHISEEPHPLLRDELLSIKVDKADDANLEGEPQEQAEVIDAFGTLSITDKGTSRFFGAAGGTEILLLNEDDSGTRTPIYTSGVNSASPESARDSKSPRLPPELTLFSNSFPFTPIGPARDVQEKIQSYLPSWDRAVSLSEIYLEKAAWLFRAVSRPQLMNEMLPIIYKRSAPLDPAHEYSGPHDLSVLFMVFAVGALVDLTQEPYNAEADHYYQLAKAAITLQSVLEKPELATIQALHLMSIYNAMHQPVEEDGECETSMEMSWSLIRLCHQLAQTIGLHRDSARWGLHAREVQRRRALFWDLYVADSWQSLATGRPPSITLPYIDCAFPEDDEARLNDKGETEPGFGTWSLRFACECVGQISAKTLTASVPPYATILELDAKVRDFPIPEFPKDMPFDNSQVSMVMTRFALSHSREIILLNLHRSFFAQAMIDDPVNPLRSQYAPSFLAAYRSAVHILKTIREQFEIVPELCSRFWSTWTFAFSSAVVFGSIVTRGPSSSMAPSSLAELDSACELFSRAAIHSRRASKALAILQKLQSKAHSAYESCLQSKTTPDGTGSSQVSLGTTAVGEKEDELTIFGGRTRLVASKKGGSSMGGSPPYIQGMTPEERPTPPPLSAVPLSATSSSGSREISESPTVPYPAANSGNSEIRMSRIDMRQTTSVEDPGFNPRQSLPDASWTRQYPDVYKERSSSIYSEGAYNVDYNSRGSVNVHNGGQGVKYEWETPGMLGNSQHQPHQASPHPYPHAPSYSHPSHSSMREMDGLEYGQHHQPGLPPHYATHGQTHVHGAHDGYNPAFHAPPPPSGGQVYHGSSPGANINVQMGGNGMNSAYAPAPPRELAEMGLASQHSGLNQRWTSFMHDSGLFYGSGGGA